MYLQTQQLSQFQYLSVNFYCLVHDWFLEFKNSNKKERFELILNEFWQIHDLLVGIPNVKAESAFGG